MWHPFFQILKWCQIGVKLIAKFWVLAPSNILIPQIFTGVGTILVPYSVWVGGWVAQMTMFDKKGGVKISENLTPLSKSGIGLKLALFSKRPFPEHFLNRPRKFLR